MNQVGRRRSNVVMMLSDLMNIKMVQSTQQLVKIETTDLSCQSVGLRSVCKVVVISLHCKILCFHPPCKPGLLSSLSLTQFYPHQRGREIPLSDLPVCNNLLLVSVLTAAGPGGGPGGVPGGVPGCPGCLSWSE